MLVVLTCLAYMSIVLIGFIVCAVVAAAAVEIFF